MLVFVQEWGIISGNMQKQNRQREERGQKNNEYYSIIKEVLEIRIGL